jgi:hypothetical protein
MSALPKEKEQSNEDRITAATERAIAACGGDLHAAVRALIIENEFLEAEFERRTSHGYLRGLRPATAIDD